MAKKKTPITPDGLIKYDDLPVEEALWRAWNDPGSHSVQRLTWHAYRRKDVRDNMPLLARALDRLPNPNA